MAVMSDADRAKSARVFARRVYSNDACNLSHADILAAVVALDAAFEDVPTNLPNQAQSVANNLNILLPDPFKATANVTQKATLLAVWAGVKYGFITSGGD